MQKPPQETRPRNTTHGSITNFSMAKLEHQTSIEPPELEPKTSGVEFHSGHLAIISSRNNVIFIHSFDVLTLCRSGKGIYQATPSPLQGVEADQSQMEVDPRCYFHSFLTYSLSVVPEKEFVNPPLGRGGGGSITDGSGPSVLNQFIIVCFRIASREQRNSGDAILQLMVSVF
ncbi:hypothetical protein CEXT_578641 [Caerostris extrusa]|uniref:Uncharacterized protein n=1 Tax=Caerostris extrusa TaxID=172846 RepID=A0AAV4WU84_CAEEX|nr:hypothetical protein CEXT_578641 [Caerostris extrusa]